MPADYLVVIPVYDHVDLMDVAAPCEMMGWVTVIPETGQTLKVVIASESGGVIESRPAGMKIVPDCCFADISQVDLLWVPGGAPSALQQQFANPAYMGFLQRAAKDAEYVTSVCEGALLLAAAGLLNGYTATTHWAFLNCLRAYPQINVVPAAPRFASDYPRFVVDDHNGPRGIRVTGGGISSGLDESLELICRIAGAPAASNCRQTMQYFPDPPVGATIPLVSPTCADIMG